MSYAEHGSRIFLTGQFNPNPLLRYGEYVTRKRSEGRLKLFDSCSDLRAWSPHAIDNCRHFREIIEKRTPSGRIVPYDVLIESLIIMGQTELASVRRQLEKYKSLRLTPDQKKQLRAMDYSSDVQAETSATTISQESRIVEDESGIPKRPGTPAQSICSSSSNFQDIEIDSSSSTDDNSGSQEAFDSSGTYHDTINLSNQRSRQEFRSGNRSSRSYEKEDHHKVIIKKDSEIIALNHELAAKKAELEETREFCQKLESALNEKIHTMENMKKNLKNSQEKLVGVTSHVHEQIEEWKMKFYESKRVVDHFRSTLVEKSQNCAAHVQEIQTLRARYQEAEKLREERDSLLEKKLDELRIVSCQKNDLMILNKQQAINLADQEDEINRLLVYIKQNQAKQDKQEMRLKNELHQLRSELEAKTSVLSQLETHQVTVRTDISPTGSLSRVETSEILKFKKVLEEDSRAVEKELSRRAAHKNDYHRDEEMASRLQQTMVRTSDGPAQREKQHSHQDLMECTIEKLPKQVSATKNSTEEEVVREEKVCTDLKNAKGTLQRLVLELEPYVEERRALSEEIKCLKESLESVKRDSKAQDVKMKKQQWEEDTRKIAHLENLLKEKTRQGTDDEMDKEIDKVLAIHVKRSIERLTKLSYGLKGAGDDLAKIRDEVEIRESEIVKLKEQVKFHVSRGQGDEANTEKFKEIVKLKIEKKHLTDELRDREESLKKTKDELQSRDFELRGLKKQKNDLAAQYKQDIQKIQKHIETIKKERDGFAKENEGLNKSVAIFNDLVAESDELRAKLDALQVENAKLIEENTSMLKRCEEYEIRLLDFSEKEMQAKADLDRGQLKLQQETAKYEMELEELRRENEQLVEQSEATKSRISELTKELEQLRENKKTFNQMDNIWLELSKLGEDKEALDTRVTRLRRDLESHQRTNDKLENDLMWQISDNEKVQFAIEKLKDDIAIITNEQSFDGTTKKLLATLPNKISENLEKLSKQLSTKESCGGITEWKHEMEDIKEKSMEDKALMGKLHEEILSWKKKITEQEEKINALEAANADLLNQLKNTESSNKSQADLSNEIKNKEQEIEKLARDVEFKNGELRNLNEKIESLVKEKNEMCNELKVEQEVRGNLLKDVQQKYNERIKVLEARHDDSIKNFLAQQEELMKHNGNVLDPELLKSLTTKELTDLHKRLCALSPCESIVDAATKTRALNDKQNQELQLKEKLHTDTFHRKNEYEKESLIGRYVYERRNFDDAKYKSVETSYDNNNVMTRKRKNFIQECAAKHKYDISH
ncbi:myosin-7-like [Venturia canescens]|uniref:myosin-7-like n=1 Tax=Venturia canescens TaxID=32260 RepID=UPI001C9BD2E8|nr:myosin-7-like [Venturia canescens]